MTKEMLERLEVGDSISKHTTDKKEIQRIRNYAFKLKKKGFDFTVKSYLGDVTVTRIDTSTPVRLTDQLRAMRKGEIIHPCRAKDRDNVAGTVSALGGGYKISLVVQVEKL